MYSEADLQSAVSAGAISREAANALRNHARGLRNAPVADEEHFRLITGFNDIFVTIAAVMLLVALAGIGDAVAPGVAGALVAFGAWAMAEFFTRIRRMALPSIALLLAFVGGTVAIPIEILDASNANWADSVKAMIGAGIALSGAVAAWFHWRRFKVPITIAAGAAAIASTVIALIAAPLMPMFKDGGGETILMALIFVAGLAIFGWAMRWDVSDRARETRRSDVAFWLHLLAAPMIAHPLFHWLGVSDGENIGAGAAIGVLAIYIVMALVALAVDRRALLVSALAYVLIALTWLFDRFGMVELSVAVTALIIGSALLVLSAFWAPIRGAVLRLLPGELGGMLPAPA